MANHNDTGKKGESLAVEYFLQKGYEILHRNWRFKKLEVDIIASANGMLHFIEVKTRSTDRFGYPEEQVDRKKIRFLIDASAEYLFQHPQWQRIQFDVLSVIINNNGKIDYFLIEDVYL